MIKKIFFQSIFFNFFFIKEVFAAESGGMPQLNPEFWISQIFWLTLTFGILYVVLSKLILPKISANLELRKSQIQENIEAAEKQRESSESKLKEYDEIILKSKLEAAKMIGAGLAAIALAGAGVGIGIIFGNYLSGAMRNPSAAQKQFPNLLLGFALAEATGLFGLVVALIILFAF